MGSTEVLSAAEWLKAVQKRLGTTDCKVLQVQSSQLGDGLLGFMGEHLRVMVRVLKTDKEPALQETLAFFIKRIPCDSPENTDWLVSTRVFEKESGLFSSVFEKLPPCRSPWSPQCYHAGSNIIVLDDLSQQGFSIMGRSKPMDYNHAALLLQTLAGFHAAAIAFEEMESASLKKQIRLNELYPELLRENMFSREEECKFRLWLKSGVMTLKRAVSLCPKYKDDTKKLEEISEKFTEALDQVYDLSEPSKIFRNVICHGDLWANNFMFRYEEEVPVEVRLVDFQIARYAPPAMDVMMFLHLSAGFEFRKENKEKLLSVYYNSLRTELARHDCDVESLLPWADFRESCEIYKTFAIIITPLYHNTDLMPEEKLNGYNSNPDQLEIMRFGDKYDFVEECFNSDQKYRDMLIAELEELVEEVVLKFK